MNVNHFIHVAGYIDPTFETEWISEAHQTIERFPVSSLTVVWNRYKSNSFVIQAHYEDGTPGPIFFAHFNSSEAANKVLLLIKDTEILFL